MATLVSLQLVRVAGVRDHHATSFSVSGRRPRVVLHSLPLRGSGLKTTSQARVGSLQGGGAFCCPLWSHLLIAKSNARVRASRLQIAASSIRPIPTEQEIKQIGAIFVNYGGHLLRRIASLIQRCPPLVVDVAPAIGLVAYSIWGLGPTTRMLRKTVFKRNDKKWDESRTYNIMASYMRPILLWIGIILICRAFDPVMLGTEASQAIKQRFVNFVRSLSTVLAFAFCTASLTQQVQRFMLENQDAEESRNVGVQFIGNTVYTSVWVAAVCLFMELLGFSTQKWITAGGFGTVLITLAGREIFTNFLSSIMIHATRPFVDNEWIQTKIEGQEVSGTVEHVGWWSPTVIRGDDREAVHIPNHKFSVSVVRNLSQKTHWRIKTHLGISHLDVNKINPIVADMRKVLAKHPQVEQRRLHRRVFFDQIDPENQALMILISAFVKTSHFEEYLRVKEIILLDLLKVISHHGARLATPIRSVQRVMDETESRSSPFRDMQNANHSQRRPLLLLDSQEASSDEEEDDTDDIQDTILRLSEQLAKDDKVAASTKDNENEESAKESSDLKPPKPKEVVADGTLLQTPVPVQQNDNPTSSDDSLPLETDVRENLMDRTYAGTEEALVKFHTDAGSLHENGHPVAATHVPATELVVEMPEEKVPHLYSNNVGLADVDASPESETSLPSIKINVHSDLTNQDVNTATTTTEEHQVQITHAKNVGIHVDIGSSTTSIIDGSRKEPDSSERDDHGANGEEALENVHSVHGDPTDHAASAETTATGEHQVQITQRVNDKHVGVHVAVGNSATSINDPCKQPSTSERDQDNASGVEEALEDVHSVLSGEAAASLTTTEEHQVHVTQKVNDKHVGVHVAVGNSTTTTTIDDHRKQPSSSERDAMNAIRKEEALEDVRSDLTDEAAASLTTTEEHRVHVTQKGNDKHVGVHVAVGGSNTTTTIDDPWKEPSTSERDAKNVSRGEEALEDVHSDLPDEAAAFVRTTEQHQVEITQNVNDMHVGIHVAVGGSTATTTIDDPWKISERDGNNAEDLEAAARSSETRRESPASTSASSSSGDPWTRQQTVHNAQKAAAPSRPPVDPNLIPGVAIEGPKHTLPLDEDIALLDDSPTLVALGNPKSSKERRESAAGPKGGASRDPDRD